MSEFLNANFCISETFLCISEAFLAMKVSVKGGSDSPHQKEAKKTQKTSSSKESLWAYEGTFLPFLCCMTL